MDITDFCHHLPKIELHAHLSGSVPYRTIQKLLLETPTQRCSDTESSQEVAPINLHKLIDDSIDELKHEVDKHAEQKELSGERGEFKKDDTKLLTLIEEQALDRSTTVEKKSKKRSIQECFDVFLLLHRVINSLEVLKVAAVAALEEFETDNVVYLELRSTPRAFPGGTKRDYLVTLLEVLADWHERSSRLTVRLLVSLDRSQSLKDAEENTSLALELRQTAPHGHLLVGLDVSGAPHVGSLSSLLPLLQRARQGGLGVVVHVCEVASSTCYSEALQVVQGVQVARLGHATFLLQEPAGDASERQAQQQLLHEVRRQRLPIEMCPTSNLYCRTVSTLSQHHFWPWFTEDHPVCVCSDDPTVFQTSLSEEFISLSQEFSLTFDQLQRLTIAAVDASLLTTDERSALRQRLRGQFH